MIIRRNEMRKETRKNMRGGEKDVTITHILEKDQMHNSRLLAFVTIPEKGSIGLHEHINEVEYYIILKGNGFVIDGDDEREVKLHDVIVTPHGHRHSIKNIGEGELEFVAIIITY